LLTAANITELQRRIALFEDMDAYKALYYHYFDELHRFASSIVKSSEAAEEIVSDVFIKIWQIRSRLTEIENLRVYCYTIARNLSLNYLQRVLKNPPARLEDIKIEPQVEFGNPEDIFITEELKKRIQQVIHELPPQCRLVFQLVKEEGMAYKEAAEIMQVSPLTVRNQLAIAVKKIAAALPDLDSGKKVLRST
jgi:RNA polymerase sigma-70 factor (ECF subfamily)